MNKRLIINADDFGFDRDATAAILDLLIEQKISSTTVLANMAKQSDLNKLKKIPNIGIGLHVNFLDGEPLAPSQHISSILDEKGSFLGAKQLFYQALKGKINPIHLSTELEAQANFLKDHGIKITHADSHQHLHHFPIIGKIIQNKLHQLGIQKIRNSDASSITSKPRSLILKGFTSFTPINQKLFTTTEGLISDLSFGKEINQKLMLQSLIKSFKSQNLLELMTHPGIANRADSYLEREKEYQLWKSINLVEELAALGIELIHFGEI